MEFGITKAEAVRLALDSCVAFPLPIGTLGCANCTLAIIDEVHP